MCVCVGLCGFVWQTDLIRWAPSAGRSSLVGAMEVADLVLDLRLQCQGDVLEVLVVRVLVLHHDRILEADQIVQLRRAVLVGAGAAVVEVTVGGAGAGGVLVVAAAAVGRRRRRRGVVDCCTVDADGGLLLVGILLGGGWLEVGRVFGGKG